MKLKSLVFSTILLMSVAGKAHAADFSGIIQIPVILNIVILAGSNVLSLAIESGTTTLYAGTAGGGVFRITGRGASNSGGGVGCFIATAAFGSSMESQVELLRNFRDHFLLQNRIGRSFVDFYYTHSPPVAEYIADNKVLCSAVRFGLLPVIAVSWMALHFGLGTTVTTIFMLLMAIGSASFLLVRKMRLREVSKKGH